MEGDVGNLRFLKTASVRSGLGDQASMRHVGSRPEWIAHAGSRSSRSSISPTSGARRGFRGVIVMIALIYCVLGCFVWLSRGEVLTRPLEERFKRAGYSDVSRAKGMIVLGGGYERLLEAKRVAREFRHLSLLVSGASRVDQEYCGREFHDFRMQIDSRPLNTHQNAYYARAVLEPRSGEQWLLVTSATHMPRAVGAFRQVGFSVLPWPVFDLNTVGRPPGVVAAYEWLGLGWYWLLGRTSAVFPAPIDNIR